MSAAMCDALIAEPRLPPRWVSRSIEIATLAMTVDRHRDGNNILDSRTIMPRKRQLALRKAARAEGIHQRGLIRETTYLQSDEEAALVAYSERGRSARPKCCGER